MRLRPKAAWSQASVCLLALSALAGAPAALAGDLGVTGVLDTPTARMGGDGNLTLTYARNEIVDNYSIGYRPTPWLEAAFRYAIFNPRGLEASGDTLRDRTAEVKVRLLREGRYLPQVAIGIRDLLGTGAQEGEYVVASKAFGPLDLTVGLGWGQLAERSIGSNPLTKINSSFETRSSSPGGGQLNPGKYFSGSDVGLFGSVRYDLPYWNLALKANYNSDTYFRAVRRGTNTDPISFGVEWAPIETFSIGASWQQGNSLALNFRATLDTGRATPRKAPNRYGAPGTRLAPSGRPGPDADWYRRMSVEAGTSGVLVNSASPIDEDTLQVVYTNRDFQYEADAIRHVLSLAERYAPREYDTFLLTGRRLGGHTHSVRYERPGRANSEPDCYPICVIEEEVVVLPTVVLPPKDPEHKTAFRYPNATLDLDLAIRPFLFDPLDPFRYQAVARIGTRVALAEGWGFSTSWFQNLYTEFDEIRQPSDSKLQPVRTDLVSYLQEGKSWLNHMVLTWTGQPAENFHVVAFGGILEQMYTGVGGEVLYRPAGSRFGIGANIIGVQQREFDGLFGLRDYQTVIGHISAYWASPFYNMDVAVHAGRYLARDWGATLEVQRRFANGWSVGAFATLTDVPFSEFGEGSFDKGLIFRMPFNLFTGFNTQDGYSTVMRPIQRDGGQRLVWGTTLWDGLRSTGRDQLEATRGGMRP